MNGSEWRDRTPRGCASCGREWPSERLELVERLVRAERALRVAETSVRVSLAEFPRDALSVLAGENVELRDTVARLNARIAQLNRRSA